MKRVLREATGQNTNTVSLRTSLRMRETRLQEDVNKLQAEISNIIDRAMQTKIIIERLAQGDEHFDVNFYEGMANDYVEYQTPEQSTTYQESRKYHRFKRF